VILKNQFIATVHI